MTTTEPTTTPAWLNLDELCPPEMREEVAATVEELGLFLEHVRPTLERAGELVARFQLEDHRLTRALAARCLDPETTPDVYELIDAATGLSDLYNAMEGIAEAAHPESNELYAAIACTGQLAIGVQVLIDTPDGVRRVTPMYEAPAEGGQRRFHTFDYQTKAEAEVITHDQLIEGIIRARAAALPVDADLAEAFGEDEN